MHLVAEIPETRRFLLNHGGEKRRGRGAQTTFNIWPLHKHTISNWKLQMRHGRSGAVEKRMDPSMAKADSPECYHCNPIMDALGLDRIASRPAAGYHSWLFV